MKDKSIVNPVFATLNGLRTASDYLDRAADMFALGYRGVATVNITAAFHFLDWALKQGKLPLEEGQLSTIRSHVEAGISSCRSARKANDRKRHPKSARSRS